MSPDGDEEPSDDDGPPKTEGPPNEPVLAPEDLEFTHHEEVAELDEGKFVIGTEGPPNPDAVEDALDDGDGPSVDSSGSTVGTSTDSPRDESPSLQERSRSRSDELSGREVKRWLTDELERTDSLYAYRIAAKTGDSVSHQQLASDDISMAFDALLMWYAQQVGGDTAVEEALGILLAKSNIRIRFPIGPLLAYLDQHGLEPGDDIADLIRTIRENEGLTLPKQP
ncbi:MAG: DUF7500 family protein [Halodesulfurarchaeum sp.]